MNDEIITSYLLGKKAGGGGTPPVYQDKEVSITQNGETTITKDEGYDALNSVELTVAVPQPSGKISITQNGTDIDVSSYASADVNVPAGVDPAEYFNSSITLPMYPSNVNQGWHKIVKKLIENVSITGANLGYFFYYCPCVPDNIITSNVSTTSYMYSNSNNSTGKLVVPNINFDSYTGYFDHTFSQSLYTEIDASSFGAFTTKLYLEGFANGCTNLKKINLSNLSTTATGSEISYLFAGSSSLEEIDMSSFDFTKVNSGFSNPFGSVPTNCKILVKDQDQVDWFTTNFPSLTNVQIKS